MNADNDTRSTVDRYLKALHAGDSEGLLKVLAPDVDFVGPIDSFKKATDLVAAVSKLAAIVQDIVPQKVFVDGEQACVIYDLVTNTPIGTAYVAEWFRLSEGRIKAIRVHFDARPFAAMFSAAH